MAFWKGNTVIDVAGFAVNTYAYTFSHTAADCLQAYAGSARGLEVMMYPGHAWPDDLDAAARRDLVKLSADTGVPLISLNSPNIDINVAAAAPGMRAYSIDLVCRIIKLAGDLGVPGVVFGPGKQNPLMPAPRETLLGYFQDAMERFVPAARAAGTRLLAENMPFAFLPDAESLMAIVVVNTITTNAAILRTVSPSTCSARMNASESWCCTARITPRPRPAMPEAGIRKPDKSPAKARNTIPPRMTTSTQFIRLAGALVALPLRRRIRLG